MKKQFLFLALILCAVGSAEAQEVPEKPQPPKKYVNFGFSMLELRQPGFPALKSNYGASFTVGRTYFLHRKPVARILRFGIDATWFDLNYANYRIELRDSDHESELLNYHQAELAMQVGPSISINPVGKLNIHTYFRYAPSFSGLYDGDVFMGNYASVFVGGGAVSYGKVGLGVEARFGSSRHKELFGGGDDEKSGDDNAEVLSRTKFSGMRFYISLRF